ncbi:nuclear mRNA export, poly(A)+RNA binding protein [Kalmusia sp. IMI 367209]|nr:nuclear mRNA export, poly(A)+RNA binding protein [Kalmusia sp. IMI 367209]
MPGSATSRPRGGGIRKQRAKRDRDGDLVMGAAPRVSPAPRAQRAAGPGPRPRNTPTAAFVELKVTGWTDDKELSKLINFLERHAARRSPNASKSSLPPKMIKRHRVAGTVLTISVRPEDVTAFSKINGFTFTSTHGTQKLNIAGPGIRSKSPTASTAMDVTTSDGASRNKSTTSETVELLKGFLFRRYNPEGKLLNLSTIAEDEEVAKSGMFNSEATQQKFFPALMVICDQTLKSAEEKRDAIHSVTLSGNNLPNLDVVRNLANTLPHIQNLDLSGNKFASIRDLKPWKNRFRSLEHLIVEITEPGWEEELVSWFPKLRILNGQQVRPDPVAPIPTSSTTAPSAAPAVAPAVAAAVAPPAAPAPGFTQEQEAMVTYVMEQTNLKREMAVQCLEAGKWNIEAAAQLFQATKDTLTPDSFN